MSCVYLVCIDDARGCDISSIISVSTTSLGRDGAATQQWGRAVAPTRADSSSADYANARQAKYVAIIGSEELEKQQFTLKDMDTGNQQLVDIKALIDKLS